MFSIITGAFGALAGFFFFVVFGGVSVASDYIPLRGFTLVALMALMFVLAVPYIIAGLGLLRFRPWARTFTTVLSMPGFLNFPLGTVLSVYALWVLLSPDTDPLFSPRFNERRAP
jgi:hypothetical protein